MGIAGKMAAKLNFGEAMLKSAGLKRDRVRNVEYTYPISDVRDLSLSSQWQYFLENRYYDIALKDYGLFQFIYRSSESFSWVYFSCPYLNFKTKSEFEKQEENTKEGKEGDIDFLYEAFLNELPLNPCFTCIRYDYSPSLFVSGKHPAAHLHIGTTELRIGSKKIFNPQTFISFILRQCYVTSWLLLLNRGRHVVASDISNGLPDIDGQHYGSFDALEHYLH